TVFRLTKDGSAFTGLRSFTGAVSDGANPRAGLVEGTDGALYGTTDFSVFKLNKDGSGYAVLRNFVGSPDDGQNLQACLLKGSDGALYGTAYRGGDMGLGTVFRLFSSVPAPVLLPLLRDKAGLPIISWRAISGLTYQVQWTAALNGANWEPLTPNVTAVTNAASKADNSGGASPRYYRVQWIP
ncbi:MAG TPA: choice-of-anchor tandem repeat GloVer-containing protein, partial [Candidatus Sulfotelmatobacter sp.]|nr:choice-of-anchor tandem repeat GloVer-containing protein [Candidatus Sulfotelmatobacter sp.]